MLAGEDLITDLNDQFVSLLVETLARMVRVLVAFLSMVYAVIISSGIRSLPILKCQRALRLRAPQSLSEGKS